MHTTTLSNDRLLQALNKAKSETKAGLLDVFTAKIERLAAHIRNDRLSPVEAAELLEQEAETMRSQHRGDI